MNNLWGNIRKINKGFTYASLTKSGEVGERKTD